MGTALLIVHVTGLAVGFYVGGRFARNHPRLMRWFWGK